MDTQELVSVHTYITQVAEKFDLRTTMLVRSADQMSKLDNKSMLSILTVLKILLMPVGGTVIVTKLCDVHV